MTYDDAELLNKAAKAAGIQSRISDFEFDGEPYFIRPGKIYEQWDPLNDDGDALRLATQLTISINFEFWVSIPGKVVECSHDGVTTTYSIQNNPDSAVRLAIVMMAAAIGEKS